MTKRTLTMAAVTMSVVFLASCGQTAVEGQQEATKKPGEGFAAVPGLKGGQDVFGPYDPVQKWPLPLAESLPNHQGWTWSQSTDVFAESPDRVIVAQKGLTGVHLNPVGDFNALREVRRVSTPPSSARSSTRD